MGFFICKISHKQIKVAELLLIKNCLLFFVCVTLEYRWIENEVTKLYLSANAKTPF